MHRDDTSSQPLSASVATFAAQLSAQQKQDISDLLLQADIFASTTWDRRIHWSAWVDYHRNRLERYGCRVRSVLINPPLFINSIEELEAPIRLSTKGGDGSPQLHKLATDALNRSNCYAFAAEFLNKGAEDEHLGSFQVVPCIKHSNGVAILLVCGVHIRGRYDDGRREVVMRWRGAEYEFDSQRYEPHRATVHQCLTRYGTQRLEHIYL
jgi:hypothetical protein